MESTELVNFKGRVRSSSYGTEQVLEKSVAANDKKIIKQHKQVIQLENDMKDLCELVMETGKLVREQQSFVDTIETKIVKSHDNVINAGNELAKAEVYLRKKQKCCFVLIAIFCIIMIILIGIFLLRK